MPRLRIQLLRATKTSTFIAKMLHILNLRVHLIFRSRCVGNIQPGGPGEQLHPVSCWSSLGCAVVQTCPGLLEASDCSPKPGIVVRLVFEVFLRLLAQVPGTAMSRWTSPPWSTKRWRRPPPCRTVHKGRARLRNGHSRCKEFNAWYPCCGYAHLPKIRLASASTCEGQDGWQRSLYQVLPPKPQNPLHPKP